MQGRGGPDLTFYQATSLAIKALDRFPITRSNLIALHAVSICLKRHLELGHSQRRFWYYSTTSHPPTLNSILELQ
jgi:hypothetical protein